MYRTTSNGSYGDFYNKTNSASQGMPGATQTFSKDYYGQSHFQYPYGQQSHSSNSGNSRQPQFNVGVQKSTQNKSSTDIVPQHPSLGLPNLGNTCYMNSVLQCLFNTKKLYSYFSSGTHFMDSANPVISEVFGVLFANVFTDANSGSILSDLRVFKDWIGDVNLTFAGYAQNDAHEFFRFLLEKINRELNQAKGKSQHYTEFKPSSPNISTVQMAEEWKNFSKLRENSIINTLFGGCIVSEVTCLTCFHRSISFENTLDLSLDLPKTTGVHLHHPTISLAKCFEEFKNEVSVAEYQCSKCKKTGKAKRQLSIWKQPEILVIQLKRFLLDRHGKLEARKDHISFPLSDLDLNPFTNKDSKEPRGKYKLHGFVNHYGGLNSGHYTAMIEAKDGSWLQYSDDDVKRLSLLETCNIAKGSAEPYLLFYAKC